MIKYNRTIDLESIKPKVLTRSAKVLFTLHDCHILASFIERIHEIISRSVNSQYREFKNAFINEDPKKEARVSLCSMLEESIPFLDYPVSLMEPQRLLMEQFKAELRGDANPTFIILTAYNAALLVNLLIDAYQGYQANPILTFQGILDDIMAIKKDKPRNDLLKNYFHFTESIPVFFSSELEAEDHLRLYKYLYDFYLSMASEL